MPVFSARTFRAPTFRAPRDRRISGWGVRSRQPRVSRRGGGVVWAAVSYAPRQDWYGLAAAARAQQQQPPPPPSVVTQWS